MRILDLDALPVAAITDYGSVAAAAVELAHGGGEGHVYVLRFEPGGVIGPHPAGFGQLLVPLEGRGWAAGGDGVRRPLARGQVAVIAPGEVHSKGSDEGMTALMIQLSTLAADAGG